MIVQLHRLIVYTALLRTVPQLMPLNPHISGRWAGHCVMVMTALLTQPWFQATTREISLQTLGLVAQIWDIFTPRGSGYKQRVRQFSTQALRC